MTTDTLTLIRNSLESLRKSEKKVADCVLADPKAVVSSSITELAEKSGTSEPTVIRFCRKLGLGGYMELRLNMARDLPTAKYIFENISEDDSQKEIASKVVNAHSEAISTLLTKLDPVELAKAVSLLYSARRIEFYGFGGSAIVAKDAYHKFFRLGIPCAAHDDSHMQVMSASLLTPEDVIVVISHTGSSKDLLESATIASKCGAKVIGIIGKENAPLLKYCDVVLSARSQEAAILLAPMTSRLVQLAILDVLFVSISMKNFSGTKDRLDRVKRSLVDKRH